MNPHYERVALRARHRCEYCHAPEIIFNFPFEIEHIIPVTLDGANDNFNLALSCRLCNLYKSSHITGNDSETQTDVPLFNPRKNTWNQHFIVDSQSGEIIGLTKKGRATINRLQMNRESQVVARKQWMLLELFP
jgi:hypothetical protein